MIVDLDRYKGTCSCGKVHEMVTGFVVIESGCLKNLDRYLEENDITGKRCVIYDENTFRASEGSHPHADQQIVLDPTNLHANEISTAYVLSILEPDIDFIVAIGTGTIHDISRFCAHDRGINFVSCPTGASVDGFCSTVTSMTWYGYKKTMPAVAPVMVVADTEIVKNAPPALVKSGVGDILAKYTALADWRIANAVTGEYLCETIYEIMDEAVKMVADGIDGILTGSDEAYEAVMYALVMSGVAMQMMGNSRPASGCEHHVSHMIEMNTPALEVRFDALHGEKTGVGAVIGAGEYHRLAQYEDIAPMLMPYEPADPEYIKEIFREKLQDAIFEENETDILATVDNEKFAAAWPEVRKIIDGIPSAEEIYEMLERLDAKRTLPEIGVSDDKLPLIIKASPLVRNRLTLMRMKRLIKEQ